MSKAEGYELHLYCDNDHKLLRQFADATKAACYKRARQRGWKVGKKDICPYCMGKKEKK